MRVLLQRVTSASVEVEGQLVGRIGHGLLLFVGIEANDTTEDLNWLAGKVPRLRIFADENGAMNRSIQDISGGLLVISQFTLFASTKKGNRPSFIKAAPPAAAEQMFNDANESTGRARRLRSTHDDQSSERWACHHLDRLETTRLTAVWTRSAHWSSRSKIIDDADKLSALPPRSIK